MYTIEIDSVFTELLQALGENHAAAERAAQLKIYADNANLEVVKLRHENTGMRQQILEMESALDSAELVIEDM